MGYNSWKCRICGGTFNQCEISDVLDSAGLPNFAVTAWNRSVYYVSTLNSTKERLILWKFKLLKSSAAHIFPAMCLREPLERKALIIVCCKWLLVHKLHCCSQRNLLPTVKNGRIFDIFSGSKEKKNEHLSNRSSFVVRSWLFILLWDIQTTETQSEIFIIMLPMNFIHPKFWYFYLNYILQPDLH